MSAPQEPRVMFFKEWVPQPLRVVLCLLCAFSFQLSGGIYLSSASQMVGSLALMQEDIMMAGYASFVGMTVAFPVLFRLKFRFTSRSIFLVVCPVIIVCNIITMNTGNLAILIATCFVAGAFRIWGTFECLSNVQLSLTPTRDFGVFFPVVYLIVLGSIQVSGLITVHIGDWITWRQMHLFIIGLMLVVWLTLLLFTRHFRFMKPLPLYGIDWIGGTLWSVFLLALIFAFEYGEYFDWLDAWQIRLAFIVAAVALLVNVARMYILRHPFIEIDALKYRNMVPLLFLFFMLYMFLSTPNLLQNIFTNRILQFDPLNVASLNWWNLAGTIAGCIAAYYWHARLHGNYMTPVAVGFGLIVAYQAVMYFLIDPRLNIEYLYLPTFLRGMGYIILYISLTVYASGVVPFKHFFQVLSLIGFVRTGFAPAMGTAIFGRILQYVLPANLQKLTIDLDMTNRAFSQMPYGEVYGEAMRQATLVSLREIYGLTVVVGIIFMILLLSHKYLRLNSVGRLPGMRHLKRIAKRAITTPLAHLAHKT